MNKGVRIPLAKTKPYERIGFKAFPYIDVLQDLGFNALRIQVHDERSEVKVIGATRVYLVLEGIGSFTLNGEKHWAEEGDLFVVPGGETYKYDGKMTLFEFNVYNK